MSARPLWWAGLLLLMSSCAREPHLIPAPGTQPSPGLQGGAVAEVEGIRVSAAGNHWHGSPSDLALKVTPILIRVENNSQHRLAIRHQDFEFRHLDNQNFEAIPPFDVETTVMEPVDMEGYPAFRFYVAPHLKSFYGHYEPFRDPFQFDRLWYDERFIVWHRVNMSAADKAQLALPQRLVYGASVTEWRPANLPTMDMVRLALPEGVLEPGGMVVGFVYFEHVRHVREEIRLHVDLATPNGRTLGNVQIPFTIQ
jgi:hypothetical protein